MLITVKDNLDPLYTRREVSDNASNVHTKS